ncbi:MAG TPA: ATP-binding protein, partial [Nannocystis sp.]
AQARVVAPPPPPAACPRCGAPQHLGRVTADMQLPGGGRRVFELTYTGHSHALAREGGDHVVLISDVTERALADERMRQMNLDLINARDQAMAASRSKSAFLANMSHELRTPLNAIIGYSEILLEDGRDRPGAGDLKKIRTAGTHLLGIISSVLDLSKIEAGKMGVDIEEFDVQVMLAQVLDTARPLVAANDNLLQHRVDPSVQTMVSDETKVRQILLNLLSNAAKFTRQGRVELVVGRRMLGGFHVLEFAVHDTGIGIPQDQIARLFEDFQQADNSTTRRYGGTGLGLTIVDRFCSMLGGTIEVESHVNRGSVFRVVLPERVR